MEVSIKYQLITALLSIILGAFIGLIYDMFKIFRILSGLEFSNKLQNKISSLKLPIIKQLRVNKNNKFSNAKRYSLYLLWDLLFFIVIIPIVQIFVYATSSGIVRWYIFIGAFLGFLIYYFTLSKLIAPIYEYILLGFKIIFAYAFYFIRLPLKRLFSMINGKIDSIKENKRNKRALKINKEKESRRQVLFTTGKSN